MLHRAEAEWPANHAHHRNEGFRFLGHTFWSEPLPGREQECVGGRCSACGRVSATWREAVRAPGDGSEGDGSAEGPAAPLPGTPARPSVSRRSGCLCTTSPSDRRPQGCRDALPGGSSPWECVGGTPPGKMHDPCRAAAGDLCPGSQTHGASQVMSASRVLVTSKTETGAERADTCFRLGRGEAGRCVPSPMAGDLINCVYVMAPHIKPLRELLGWSHEEVLGAWCVQGGGWRPLPAPHPALHHLRPPCRS